MNKNKDIVKKIKDRIQKNAPKAKVYLYGSRARNEAKTESDWDILILVQQDKVTNELEYQITDPLYDLEFETGEVISPIIYSEKEWNSKYKITSFFHNVMNEGKLL